MDDMLDCHMRCLEFLPIPIIDICANTYAAIEQVEVDDYIPQLEFNRSSDQEPTTEPNDKLLDDEEYNAFIGNDIEDPPNGVEYEDEDLNDYNDDDEWSAHRGEVWNESLDLKKGLVFPDKKSLRQAVKIFSFKRHVNYNVTRSREKSYEATCVKHENGCPWRVRACLKANLGMWLIAKYGGDHSCVTPSVSQDHTKLDSDIIARKVWLGKQKALAMHRPIPDDDNAMQFHRLFWAFKPCIDAWAHLKPMVQVDGTFLYGKYHHTLLVAMSQDGNRNI
ncbi:hypothetical protein G2W53_007291 [Senna tora]|uniref:Transposase MuDR plant domain-containing protein n=1 Tax=Senna tora TaxID=362788 RepID=A0A834X648_9FABA|nr:hypothetical protein G2W53_007291 [Senna tora]